MACALCGISSKYNHKLDFIEDIGFSSISKRAFLVKSQLFMKRDRLTTTQSIEVVETYYTNDDSNVLEVPFNQAIGKILMDLEGTGSVTDIL